MILKIVVCNYRDYKIEDFRNGANKVLMKRKTGFKYNCIFKPFYGE